MLLAGSYPEEHKPCFFLYTTGLCYAVLNLTQCRLDMACGIS